MPKQDCGQLIYFQGVMTSMAMQPSEINCRNLLRVTNLRKWELRTSDGLVAL